MHPGKFYKIDAPISPNYIHVIDTFTKKNWIGIEHLYIVYNLAGYVHERIAKVSDIHVIIEITQEQYQIYRQKLIEFNSRI